MPEEEKPMEEKKLRSWENWVVLAGIAFYARSYLLAAAARFNSCLDILAGNGIPAEMINQSLGDYSPVRNIIVPVILLAAFVYLAWFTFHRYAFPLLRKKSFSPAGIPYLFLTVVLLLAGCFLFGHFRIYPELTSYHGGFEDSFHFFQVTRKISLLGYSLTLLWAIFLFEAFSQGFYALCGRLRREGPMFDLVINFLFAICSLVFLVFLGVLGNIQHFELRELPGHTSVPFVLVMAVAVIYGQDYFYLDLQAKRSRKGYLSGVFGVIALCFFSALLIEVLQVIYRITDGQKGGDQDFRPTFEALRYAVMNHLPRSGSVALPAAALALGAGWVRYLFYRQENKLQAQVTVKSAELDQLRAQVNPHFLFNALNTLYSVALKENAETTASGIQKLGDMMRFMLNENNHDQISISREVEQLENYIDIQRMRIDETPDIRITVHLQQPGTEIRIAPMLLNPFVENAFKHGISLVNPSWIHITLTFDKESLFFKVHNSLHAARDTDPEKFNNGIGLENVRRRLNLLYPQRHRLVIEQSEQDFFVSLTLRY